MPQGVYDIDVLGNEITRMAAMARSMAPGWDKGRVKHRVAGPGGRNLGWILPGRGFYLDMDAKELGLRGSIPYLFERTPVRKLADKLGTPDNEFLELDLARFAIHDLERKHRFRTIYQGDFDYNGIELSESVKRSMETCAVITSYDGIIAARAGGKANDIAASKVSFTTTANDWYCNARIAGSPGAMTFNSTTAPTETAVDRTTTGVLSTGLYNPAGSDKKYLLTFGWVAIQQINMGILIDIHVQGGSFRATVNTAETVASPVTIVRNYTPGGVLGAGVYMIAVTTTAITTPAAANWTITYVDQDGNTGQTVVVAFPATATIADQLGPDTSSSTGPNHPFFGFASGDYGVRSMSQTQFSVAHGAAGAFAVLLVSPLVFMPGIAANAYVERDSTVQIDGITELVVSSGVIGGLSLLMLPNTTSTGQHSMFFRTCSG